MNDTPLLPPDSGRDWTLGDSHREPPRGYRIHIKRTQFTDPYCDNEISFWWVQEQDSDTYNILPQERLATIFPDRETAQQVVSALRRDDRQNCASAGDRDYSLTITLVPIWGKLA